MGSNLSKESESICVVTHDCVPPGKTGQTVHSRHGELGNHRIAELPFTVSSLLAWSQFSKLDQGLAITPSWDLAQVMRRHDEINTLISGGTLALLPDQSPFDAFYKAAHMVSWYANTVRLWELSMMNSNENGTIASRMKICDGLSDFLNIKQLSDMLGIFFVLARYGLMEKFCKWSSATLWADTLQQKELPPVPDFVRACGLTKYKYMCAGNRWVGLCKKIPKSGTKGQKKLMMMIAKDIYTTKSSSLPVDNSFIEENIEKHKKILCTPHLDDPLSKKIEKLILKAIDLCADDIFGPLPTQDETIVIKKNKKTGELKTKIYKVPETRRPPSRLPSLGASVDCGRGKGGALGDLLSKHGENYTLPEPATGYLHSYCSYKYKVTEVRTYYNSELYFEAEESSRIHSYHKDSVHAQVVPLLEAFKVRTITKGDADQYHLARRWQKVIHSRMRKQQNCRLIGQPCNSAYLSQIFGNSPLFSHNEEGFFVSGDYESATDLLHPHLSVYANEAICQRLRVPLEDQIVLKRCLTEHLLKYTAKGEYFQQQWGQLMGSPTSFPILCLINLAATKVAYEEFFRSLGLLKSNEYMLLEELPMCVNGDDILFWCYDGALYEKWKEVTKACGLKFSLGKNYTHNRVAIINSQMYMFNEQKEIKSFSKSRSFSRAVNQFDKFPALSFELCRTMNSRLLSGGQRAVMVGDDGTDLSDFTDRDLSIWADAHRGTDFLVVTRTKLNNDDRQLYNKTSTALGKMMVLRDAQRKDVDKKSDRFANYVQFRSTITQRGEKGLSMLKGSLELACPQMEKNYLETFNNIQLKKLERFRRSGLEGVDKNTPYFLPQYLGGLGLTPPQTHKYTAQEYVEIATLEGCDRQGVKWVRKNSPTPLRPPMMVAIANELLRHKDVLQIEETRKTREQIGLARFFGEDDSFWEQSFLTGFISSENMVVGREQKVEALRHLDNNTRGFKNEQLMRELRRQQKTGCALGLFKLKRSDGKVRLEASAEYADGFDIDVKSIEMKYAQRASPKYE